MKTRRWIFFVYLLLVAVYGASLAVPSLVSFNKESVAQSGYEDLDNEEEKDGKEDVIEFTKIAQANTYRLHSTHYLLKTSRSSSSTEKQRILISDRSKLPRQKNSPNFLCVFRL